MHFGEFIYLWQLHNKKLLTQIKSSLACQARGDTAICSKSFGDMVEHVDIIWNVAQLWLRPTQHFISLFQ
jgi:hypothetical protein